jgi:hypothetical protein
MGGKPGAVGREGGGWKGRKRRRTKKRVEATEIRRNEDASKQASEAAGYSPSWSGSETQRYIRPDGHDEASATANRQPRAWQFCKVDDDDDAERGRPF